MHKFIHPILILALSSCLQVQDKNQPAAVTQAPPVEEQSEVVPLAGDFDLVPEKEINRYRLRLQPGMRFVRSGESSDSELVFQGGEQVRGVITNGSEQKAIEFEVPQDLYLVEPILPAHFQQGLVLPHPKNAGEFIIATKGRLRLAQSFRLKIGGRKVTLMADTIEFDGNQISTFEPDEVSATGNTPGGTVVLHAKKATGQVHISLNGQRGSDGASGGPTPGRAATGEDRAHIIETFNVNGIMGRPWRGQCSQALGGKGATGAKGQSGQNGGAGSPGGKLMIAIANTEKLRINLSASGGAGGNPGLGGPGQAGGLPGRSGTASLVTTHTRAGVSYVSGQTSLGCPPGQEGDHGPQGDSGNPGAAGAPGQLCFAQKDDWKCESHAKAGAIKLVK